MYRIYSTLIEILAASVFIIPLFCVYGSFLFQNAKRTALYLVFACYLVAMLSLVGFPNILYWKIHFSVNLIPFAGLSADFHNACLNVLLFVPLGFFLPLFWDKYRKASTVLLAGFCVTCIIEFSQLFTLRATDINDILTNVFGTWIGYFILKLATGNFSKYVLNGKKTWEFYLIGGTAAAVMFFLQPFVSNFLWGLIVS